MIIDTVKFITYNQKYGSVSNKQRSNTPYPKNRPISFNALQSDVFVPTFSKNLIPYENLLELGKNYLKFISKEKDEQRIYKIARDYYYENVIPLISGSRKSDEPTDAISRLFRHELLNSTSSPLELNINPDFKLIHDEVINDSAEYFVHQKNSFKDIVSKVNGMALYWKRLETWKNNKNIPIPFAEIKKQIQMAVDFSNNKQTKVYFSDKIGNSKSSLYAFDLYNLLSQVVLNGVKYSSGNPVYVEFSKTKTKSGEYYFMTVLNKGTRPIPDAEIDRILQGSGYRSQSSEVNGTGTGYKEIIKILKKYNEDRFIPALIEKGRTEGVKVTVPFGLVDKKTCL